MKRRIAWIVASDVMFAASIGLILYYLWGNGYLWKAKTAPPPPTYEEFTYPSFDESEMAELTNITTAAPTDPDTPTEPTEPSEPVSTTQPYLAPADFKLQPGVYQFCFPYFDEQMTPGIFIEMRSEIIKERDRSSSSMSSTPLISQIRSRSSMATE